MKQKLLYIIMLIVTLAWSSGVWGQNNHVPFTIDGDNWEYFATGSNLTWDRTLKRFVIDWFNTRQEYTQYGLLINNGGNLTNWNDKVITVTFTGIADVLSFDYEAQEGTTKREWYVKEPSGNGWTTLWSCTNNDQAFEGSQSIQLSPTTRQIQLIWSGNIGGVFSKVHVSELIYLRTETESIDFGTHYLYDGEIQKTFKVKHCNMKSGVSVASNVGSVTVGNNRVPGTGQDILDESTITVTYKNNSVGSIGSGKKITLDDLSNAVNDISIPMTATTLDRYMNVNKTSMSFGENMKGEAKTQTFEVSHLNLKDGIEISSSNTNFTVSSSFIETSLTNGNDATKTIITVTYLNSSTGTNNGDIIIHDKSGKIEDKTIHVSGITQTIYYTKAEAMASTGGNVYASFTDGTFISSSATTNSVATTDANASTTAYFNAQNNTGYNFKGWTASDASYEAGYLPGKGESFSETYTYNSEDSDNPTLKAYKAWFAPKAAFTVSAGVGTVAGGTASTNWAQSTQILEGTPGETHVSTSVTYTATVPNDNNYKFCGWAESQTETDKTKITGNASNTVELSGNAGAEVNKTLYAIYAPIHHFTAQAEVGEHGGGDATVEYEATVEGEPNVLTGSTKATFKADADQGYVFVGWAESKSASTAEQCISPLTEFEYEITTANPSKTLYAIFAPVFNFDATATKNRDGGTVTAMVDDSSITGEPGASSASTSATFTVTSTKSGYVFKGWKENATDTEYKSTSTTYTTSGNDDVLNNEPGTTVTKTMVAIFAPIYRFSAEAHVGNVVGGTVENATVANATVEAEPSASSADTEASFRATAYEDYTFMGWSETADGNVISGSNVSNYTPTIINNGEPGSEVKLVLYAIFKLKRINLYPNSTPSYTAGDYEEVKLHNTLKSGYSTIALPFNTTVQDIVGNDYDSATDWVAQLSVVTYNAKDGYSLYFSKSNTIVANQPYILHLGTAVNSPIFTDVSVVAAEEATQKTSNGVGYNDWTMHSNYDPAFKMNGYYGVVNGEGVLKKGTTGSTLKAFHAYITGPAAAGVKAAYLDEDEADGILELLNAEATEPENIYDLQGRQLPRAGKGINIIRNADGSVRKVMLK